MSLQTGQFFVGRVWGVGCWEERERMAALSTQEMALFLRPLVCFLMFYGRGFALVAARPLTAR